MLNLLNVQTGLGEGSFCFPGLIMSVEILDSRILVLWLRAGGTTERVCTFSPNGDCLLDRTAEGDLTYPEGEPCLQLDCIFSRPSNGRWKNRAVIKSPGISGWG